MSARARLAAARSLARLVVDAWPALVRGHLPVLADQVPISRERQPGHPRWCSQGSQCWPPDAGSHPDGGQIVEVVHCSVTRVEHKDGVAEVAVERFDTLHDDGRLDVEQVVYLNTDGTFDADQAEAYALSILRAVRQIDAGLDGTPGGIPAVLDALGKPWPSSEQRDTTDHREEGATHG